MRFAVPAALAALLLIALDGIGLGATGAMAGALLALRKR